MCWRVKCIESDGRERETKEKSVSSIAVIEAAKLLSTQLPLQMKMLKKSRSQLEKKKNKY